MISKVYALIKKEPVILAPFVFLSLFSSLMMSWMPSYFEYPFELNILGLIIMIIQVLCLILCLYFCANSYLGVKIDLSSFFVTIKRSAGSLMSFFIALELSPKLVMHFLFSQFKIDRLQVDTISFPDHLMELSITWFLISILLMFLPHFILIQERNFLNGISYAIKFIFSRVKKIIYLLTIILSMVLITGFFWMILLSLPVLFNSFAMILQGMLITFIQCLLTIFFLDEHEPKIVNVLIDDSIPNKSLV